MKVKKTKVKITEEKRELYHYLIKAKRNNLTKEYYIKV